MGNIGDAFSQTLPTVGVTAGPLYAEDINDFLEEVKARLESNVTPSSITINDNLDFNQFEATDLGAAKFQNRTDSPTGVAKVFVRDDELYFLDGAGRSVQMTLTGALNAAALGGIGGDYGGGDPASVYYTAASSRYTFTQDPGVNADIDVAAVLFREAAASANAVTIQSPAGLAASYALTLPASLPGSTSVVTMSAAGVLAGSVNLVLATVACSSTIQGTVLTGTTGVVTAEADIRHGNRDIIIQSTEALCQDGDAAIDNLGYWQSTAATRLFVPIQLLAGEKITTVHAYVRASAGSAVDVTLYEVTIATGARASLDTDSSPATAADHDVDLTGLTETTTNASAYYLQIDLNAANQRFYGAYIRTTRQ